MNCFKIAFDNMFQKGNPAVNKWQGIRSKYVDIRTMIAHGKSRDLSLETRKKIDEFKKDELYTETTEILKFTRFEFMDKI